MKLMPTQEDLEMPPSEKSAEQMMQELVYAVSHDMGASVRAMMGFADLRNRRYSERLDDDGRNFLKLMSKGAIDLQAQIDGLLAFSRVTSRGRPLLETSTADVWRSVLDAKSQLLSEINAVVDYSDLPNVMADASQLTQLLTELLDNTIKFRRDEPLKIHFSADSDSTESARRDGHRTFRMTDNGRGVANQHLERVFQLYQRLCPEVPGNGVGLAICQRIIQRHGGVIWAESEIGRGTSIRFTLPVAPSKSHEHPSLCEAITE